MGATKQFCCSNRSDDAYGLVRRWCDALCTLEQQWAEAEDEARMRLGARFQNFLASKELLKNFVAWGEYDSGEEMTSRTLLEKFSLFELPLQVPKDEHE
jgi:hypothetical protein